MKIAKVEKRTHSKKMLRCLEISKTRLVKGEKQVERRWFGVLRWPWPDSQKERNESKEDDLVLWDGLIPDFWKWRKQGETKMPCGYPVPVSPKQNKVVHWRIVSQLDCAFQLSSTLSFTLPIRTLRVIKKEKKQIIFYTSVLLLFLMCYRTWRVYESCKKLKVLSRVKSIFRSVWTLQE